MQSDIQLASHCLWFAAALLALAGLALIAHAWSARRRVGAELVAERAGRGPRWSMLLAIVAVAAWVYVLDTELPRAPIWSVLALAGGIAAFQPAAGDSIYGERGVRRGWLARSFAELEEWRLVGDHLRWKLSGEWLACRVPSEMQADLRTKLTALCPERESPFK